MKRLIIIFLCFLSQPIFAQLNCEVFKVNGNEKRYEACKVAEERAGHYQFSYEYQDALDRALAIDSTFSWAYKYKSTAFLKSGDFIGWKKLMDKAVDLDPEAHLAYRGWCRFQFFRDYKGAIDDIERLDALANYDIGFSQNGFYHLEIARALCYKGLGDSEKALQIMESKLGDEQYSPGPYVYLHLGVLHLEKGRIDAAIDNFKKQEATNDLAENRYYIALAYAQKGDNESYVSNLNLAYQKYQNGLRMMDPYVVQMDKIYLENIERELQESSSN